MQRLRLRFRGTCASCGAALTAGALALYDRPTKTVRCLACVDGPASAEAGEPSGPEPGIAEPQVAEIGVAEGSGLEPQVAEASIAEPSVDTGTAGGSARREYERRMANRETRVKDRFGRRLGGVILAVTEEPQSTRAWARGAVGEEQLAEALAGVEGICVLHDRRLRGTRGNIDHIVVAPAGVFVVDAKRYKGLIRIRDVGWLFRREERLYVGSRDCTELATGMGWQVEAVERALRAAGIDPLPPISPVLCFVDGEWPWFRPPTAYAGVRLEGAHSIRELIVAERVLDHRTIERLAGVLGRALPPK